MENFLLVGIKTDAGYLMTEEKLPFAWNSILLQLHSLTTCHHPLCTTRITPELPSALHFTHSRLLYTHTLGTWHHIQPLLSSHSAVVSEARSFPSVHSYKQTL
jgi:hypothetical protein